MCAGSLTAGTSSSSPSPPDHEFETDSLRSGHRLCALHCLFVNRGRRTAKSGVYTRLPDIGATRLPVRREVVMHRPVIIVVEGDETLCGGGRPSLVGRGAGITPGPREHR